MQKQQQKALSCSSNTAFYIVGLLAVFVYVNTLIGDFTFDDNFAVVGALYCCWCCSGLTAVAAVLK